MGGFIAQEMTFTAPVGLDALVLMDTGHGAVVSLDPTLVEAAISGSSIGRDKAFADILAGPRVTARHPALTNAS